MHFSNEMFKIRYQYLKFLTMYKLISGILPKEDKPLFLLSTCNYWIHQKTQSTWLTRNLERLSYRVYGKYGK